MMKVGTSISNGIRAFYFFLPTSSWCPPLLYSTSTSTSTPSINQGNPKPNCCSFPNFLVDYLGFSTSQSFSTSAKLANKVTDFKFIENADSVIKFFQQLGFQEYHIRKIVTREPRILFSRVQKTLKPKIDVLTDLGTSESDLIQTIVRNPLMLRQRFGPAIHALRTAIGSDHIVVTILKRSNPVHFGRVAHNLMSNVELLRNYCSISTDIIRGHISRDPKPFIVRTDLFRGFLVRVEQTLGIVRDSTMFVYGIRVVACLSEKTIQSRFQVCRSFGWTNSHVMELIRRNPLCLTLAEARTEERLGVLMNQMGYRPDYLALHPLLFICSMNKRLLPRYRVLQNLKEKGLLRMDYPLSRTIGLTKSVFLRRFVLPFEVHIYSQLTGSTVG